MDKTTESCKFIRVGDSGVSISMKTTIVAWLLIGVVALIPFAETLSCYDCFIDRTQGLSDGDRTTCPEPLMPSEKSTCEGESCFMFWSDYGSYGYTRNFTCVALPLGYKVNDCLWLNSLQSQHEFYLYNGMCCATEMYETKDKNGASIRYNYTSCGCDTDYCNGNVMMPMFTATTRTTTQASTTSSATNSTTTQATTTSSATNSTTTHATGKNAISFGNWRRSDGYIYGFALIVVNLISIMQNEFAI